MYNWIYDIVNSLLSDEPPPARVSLVNQINDRINELRMNGIEHCVIYMAPSDLQLLNDAYGIYQIGLNEQLPQGPMIFGVLVEVSEDAIKGHPKVIPVGRYAR